MCSTFLRPYKNKVIYYLPEKEIEKKLKEYLDTQGKSYMFKQIMEDNKRSVVKKFIDCIDIFKSFSEKNFIYNVGYMICIPINIVEKDYNYTKRPDPIIYNPYTSSLYRKMLGNMDGNYVSCNKYNTQEDIEKACNNDSNCIGYNYQNTGVNGVYKPKCLNNKFNLSNENNKNQYNYSDYNYVYYYKPLKINQQQISYKLSEKHIQEDKNVSNINNMYQLSDR